MLKSEHLCIDPTTSSSWWPVVMMHFGSRVAVVLSTVVHRRFGNDYLPVIVCATDRLLTLASVSHFEKLLPR